MNKNYKLLIGIGALAVLYFAFKKKGATTKSSKTDEQTLSDGVGKELSKFQIDQLKKVAVKEGDSPKVIAIKTFQADLFINPPKSEAEAKARTAKYGITVADVDEYLGNPKSQFASFEGISDEDFYKMDAKRKEIGGLFKRSSENFKRLEDFAKENNIDVNKYIDAVRKMSRKKQSRIKPTAVSGISLVQRPRNYGTAQRPTRALTPNSITPSYAEFMDFDANDDVMADML